jgi:hypothetical protein
MATDKKKVMQRYRLVFFNKSVMFSPCRRKECPGTALAVQVNCILVNERRYLKVFEE